MISSIIIILVVILVVVVDNGTHVILTRNGERPTVRVPEKNLHPLAQRVGAFVRETRHHFAKEPAHRNT